MSSIAAAPATSLEQSVLRKVTMRLIPFMFLMYIFNYLDRQNVGYAKLTMQLDLKFTETAYGTGAGIFFLGYFLFEVPSNLIMERVGARRWMARIMVTWGVISSCTMFVHSATSFYFMRFLLGLAEAGFFPGMILYLTYWFPAAERARAVSRFMTAIPMAGAIGGPISGAILQWTGGLGGLASWQWLFLIEGIPSFILGFVVLLYLTDRPEKAHWLTEEEKQILLARLERETQRKRERRHMTWAQAMTNGTVIQLTAFYFMLNVASYGFVFWLPQMIKNFRMSNLETGLVSAIPYALGAVAMVVMGHYSDRSGDRKRFVGASSLIAAIGLSCAAISIANHNPLAGVISLSVTAMGLNSTLGPFWTLPTSFLSGSAAAAGIAFINSVGNLGGFFGPAIMGRITQVTHREVGGLFVLSVAMVVGCVLALTVHHDRSLERPHDVEA